MTSKYQSTCQSMISVKSQEIIDTASRISKRFNLSGSGEQNEENITKCWGAFGLYISRQMRMGRGINIPHFGLFSFSAPGVHLEGVTNPEIRDKQNRKPVFLISKDFANGLKLNSGIFIDNHLRPFLNQTSGSIQQTKINWSEIASYAQSTKDATKFAVERLIRVLADKCRQNQVVLMQIPGIGNFHVKNNICAIQFYEQFVTTTQGIPKRPLSEKKMLGNMGLTSEKLNNFRMSLQKTLPTQIDDSGNLFLQENYNINIHSTQASTRAERTPKPISLLQRSLQISQLIRPDRMGNYDKNQPTNLEQGLKMLNHWMRVKRYISIDAFLEMCNIALGRTRDRKVKMNYDQFSKACQDMVLNLNEAQIQALFNHLDANQDGNVDYSDWISKIQDENDYINYIKDAIIRNNLHSDDILKTMGLSRDMPPIGLTQLIKGLLKLDQLLEDKQAEQVGLKILNGKKTISMQELLDVFDSYEEAGKIYDASWYKDMLFKIKEKLVNSGNYFSLRRILEDADIENLGTLDTEKFKKILKRNFGLTGPEIDRIARYLPSNMSKNNQVDFVAFLNMVDIIDIVAVSDEKVRTLYEFAEKLGGYLKKEKITIKQFLKNIWKFAKENNIEDIGQDGEIPLEIFAEYLLQNVFKQTSRADLEIYCKEVDIDNDNYIFDQDLKYFLQSQNFFEEIYYMDKEPTRHLTKSRTLNKDITTLNTKGLFPIKPLQEHKIETILQQIKKTLEYKNISNLQFFQMIDSDKDGFITYEEFTHKLDKYFLLPQYVKNGLFAYIDKGHIGQIDFLLFDKFMNISTTQPRRKIAGDSYDWQYNMIMRIREWFGNEKITVEDAFKALDKHYKGEIRQSDLHEFLIEQIKMKEEDLTTAKVNRLFKLMDQFKKGSIKCEDFRRFLCEDFVQGGNECIMGHKNIDNYSSFDWKLNARQQVGLVLTRRFNDLTHSYNMITKHQKKMDYNQFKDWINYTNCLKGFDITESQLKEFFTDLDSHKKGFLTEQDWSTAFSGYDWKRQMVEEMKEMIHGNFGNIQKAFEFFLPTKKSNSFDFKYFKTAISYLLPGRFIDSDISDLWGILSQEEPEVNFEMFEKCFTHTDQYKKSYLDTKKRFKGNDLVLAGKTLQEIEDNIPVNSEAPFLNEGLLGRLRRFLRASNKTFDVEFQKADPNNIGYLTNLQFRNLIKRMNFSLKADEIDELLNLCSFEGKFFWRNFLKMVNFRDVDHRIIDRAKLKLEYITQLIYTFMLSPKDAFRIYDENSKGFLKFDQFQKFINQIYFFAGEETPNYPIIKDMFDFIDKTKDESISLIEWMDVFSQYEYNLRQASVGTPASGAMRKKAQRLNTMQYTAYPTNYQVRKVNFNECKHQPVVLRPNDLEENKKMEYKLGEWESSKEFDKVLTAIGKNRKFLLTVFQSIPKKDLTYNIVQAVIEQMLRDSRVNVKQEAWPMLIKFAEKDGVIDYQFLLEVYKERISRIDSHPRETRNNIN